MSFRFLKSDFSDYLNDFVNLIYPNTCCCCCAALSAKEKYICFSCETDLPKVLIQENIELKFAGKLPFKYSLAMYQYAHHNHLHHILEEIKYRDNQDLAVYMGHKLGNFLLNSKIEKFDMIIPVPLHHSKLKKRGYNQSTLLAQGISDIAGIEIREDIVTRVVSTETQTKKSRVSRWLNVETVFEANRLATNKNVLILDDVLTTGATMIACAETLLQQDVASVSFLSLASAV